MKLVIGLGNLGREYEGTRHNVGFEVVDRLASLDWKKSEKLEAEVLKIDNLILAKPTTMMNATGRAVKKLTEFYKISMDDLLVVHDDLDIKLGEYKLQKGVGPKVHNGLLSIEETFKAKEFLRMRVGIDNRNGERKIRGEDYVLGKFSEDEKLVIDGLIGKVAAEILEAVRG